MKVQRHAVKAKGYRQYLAGASGGPARPRAAASLLALTLLALTLLALTLLALTLLALTLLA